MGFLSSIATIWVSLFGISRRSVVDLLRANLASSQQASSRVTNLPWLVVAGVFFIVAIALPFVAMTLEGPAKAGAYLGSGFLFARCVCVCFLFEADKRKLDEAKPKPTNISIANLAFSSLKRNRLRSLLAVSLIAVASFLLLSVSLFHVEPDEKGTGGFGLMAKSDFAINRDLNDLTVRRDALGNDAAGLESSRIVPMRLRSGDDAGCNNLYRANQPQILGVNPVIESVDKKESDDSDTKSRFAWAGYQALEAGSSQWALLKQSATGDEDSPVPVMLIKTRPCGDCTLKRQWGRSFLMTTMVDVSIFEPSDSCKIQYCKVT